MDLSQPDPRPNEARPTWDIVIGQLERYGYLEIADDARERDAEGRAKYGTPLQPHNGRDSLKDAYAEALDLMVYLKNAEIEADPVKVGRDVALYGLVQSQAVGIAYNLRKLISNREEARDEDR